jgi:hypothetical protein
VNPQRIEREDLLDDARFWALLYEHWVKPCVGDKFEDGDQYFFGVRETAVTALFEQLQNVPTAPNIYPEYSVLLPLRSGWRVGVVLSMYPDDFEVQDVVAPPSSDELIVFGVNGGNSRLLALRWQELLMLRDSVEPPEPTIKARALLLLFPSVCLSSNMRMSAVRQVLHVAWRESGIAVRHGAELIARRIDDFIEAARLYPRVKETLWRDDGRYGWINDSHHSLRNPQVDGAGRVLPVIRQLFLTMDKGK